MRTAFETNPGLLPRDQFREAMASLGSAVCIVTTNGAGGKAGFTASAVCSVSDDPPTLLVCVNHDSSVYQAFKTNQYFCVNVLSASHEPLSRIFGGKTPLEDRFASREWTVGETEVPVLSTAIVALECCTVHAVDVATHRVIFGRPLVSSGCSQEPALMYFQRHYHVIG